MKVVLNDVEQRLARYVTMKRKEFNTRKGVGELARGDVKRQAIELEGVAAEIAFCKVFNLYPDLNTTERSAEDAVLHCGIAVDIKTTRYLDGHLTAFTWKKDKPCDIYVLLVGKFPEYNIVGFATKEQLFSSIKDLGHGETFALAQKELCKI